jgi:Kef-type K+ transport system membrane component KefB
MEFRELLLSLVLVWLAAKAAGEGMERIGQTAVLGELLAGVIIGPGVLGLVHESEALHALAELGVLILLFEVGLESDLHDLAILRVIGSSPTNTQPVFETIARSRPQRLCGAGLRGVRRRWRHAPNGGDRRCPA